ncbi:MAG: secretin N-terminal domain-containing protein [Nitrospiraceae bacterium]
MRLPLLSCALLAGLVAAGCASPELRQADRFADDGQWDQAVAAYREAVKKEPFNPKIQQRMDVAKARAAGLHYAEGRRSLEENRLHDALREFKLALGLDPSKPDHHAAMNDALRMKEAREQVQAADKLQTLGRIEDALAAYEKAVELDPSLTQALEGITAITKQQRATKLIGGSNQPITLRFQNAKLKEVFEILARTAGVNVIFDREVRDDPVTIFIKDMPFDEALNLIMNTNSLVAQRIAPETLLIMPNTKQKQAQYQDLLIRTFYLSNAKAKDAVNLLRTMLESKKVYVDEKVNAVIVRDEPAKLHLAERLLFAIDRRDPEVELDMEVLEVNRTKSLKYGLNFAKQAGAGLIPSGGTGGISTALTQFTYQQLTSIGPQSYLFTLPASVLIDFFKQESDAKTLASPKLRVINGKSASINIGDKQPILLSTTNVLPGQAATGAVPTTSTVTSIEFKDTGVKLTVEPTVHLVDEVTLKLKVEVTRLGDQVTLQASPEIKQFKFGTRSAETILMMQDDETVVLAGLIQDEDRKTRSTVPILGDIPIIGELFSSTNQETVATEVVLTITPHIVRNLSAPPLATQAFWSGTETNYATAQLFPPQALSTSITSAATVPAVSSRAQTAPQQGLQQGAPPSVQPVSPSAPSAPSTAPQATSKPGIQPSAQTTPAASQPAPSVMPATPSAVTPPAGQPVPQANPLAQSDLVARGPGVLALRPADLSAVVGQEFRVDLTTQQLDRLTESLVTVSYDPTALEFRRITPGVAAISARATEGQVILTLRRQGPPAAGENVLATLFFQAKNQGDFPLTLRSTAGTGPASQTLPAVTERAVVRVR